MHETMHWRAVPTTAASAACASHLALHLSMAHRAVLMLQRRCDASPTSWLSVTLTQLRALRLAGAPTAQRGGPPVCALPARQRRLEHSLPQSLRLGPVTSSTVLSCSISSVSLWTGEWSELVDTRWSGVTGRLTVEHDAQEEQASKPRHTLCSRGHPFCFLDVFGSALSQHTTPGSGLARRAIRQPVPACAACARCRVYRGHGRGCPPRPPCPLPKPQ